MKGNPTKRIVRILTTKSGAGSDLTYEKEMLDSRKNSDFYKTNHPGFPASVRRPSSLAKTNDKPTKRIVCTLGLNVPELISLRTKKSCSIPGKTTLFPKRIIPERETAVVLAVSWRILLAPK